MARSGILYSDVAKAASQLTELGHPVTVDNVRKMLGDTGSKSTIAPYLRQWRENHALESESSRLKLPPSLLSAVQSLYEGMQQEAEIRFTEAEKLHEETVASMQAELQAQKKRLEESAQAHQEVLMELRLSQKEHRKTLETLERERLRIAGEGARRVAKDVAGELVEQDDAFEQRFGRIHVRHSAPHDLATCGRETGNLITGAFLVPSVGTAHRLDRTWCSATDLNTAYGYLSGDFFHENE